MNHDHLQCKDVLSFNRLYPHRLCDTDMPGREQIGTGVEHRTPFSPIFLQACGELHNR